MLDLDEALKRAQSVGHVRLRGPANYRGWALSIDTLDHPTLMAMQQHGEGGGPYLVKRWSLGHHFLICLTAFAAWVIFRRTPEPLRHQGERILKMRLVYVRGLDDAP